MNQAVKNVIQGYPFATLVSSSEMDAYLGKSTEDSKEKYTDGKITKALKEVIHNLDGRRDELIKWIEDAKADKNITKQFDYPMKQYDNLASFMKPERPDFRWNIHYRWARKVVLERVLPEIFSTLKPLNLSRKSDVQKAFSNVNASCGAMAPKSKKKDRMKEIVQLAQNLLANPRYRGLPALCYKRSQISGFIKNGELDGTNIKEKYRLVWCIDAATVMLEARFARPLMDTVLPRMVNYAGGKNDKEIGSILLTWWNHSTHWICFDYSQYDSTVPSWLIKDMFALIKRYFPKESWDDLAWLEREFIETGIIMPKGDIQYKKKGIPSGSYFTQLIGTLCNIQTMLTAFIAVHGQRKAMEMLSYPNGQLMLMAMGDDNVVFSRGEINVKSIVSYIGRNFGLEINEDKCDQGHSGDYPVFLKRQWRPDGAWRDVKELLVQMMHPEFWRTYDGYTPYHIIYGYMLTYPLAFEGVIRMDEIIMKMGNSDVGIQALRNIRQQDLPGSLRYLKISNPLYFEQMIAVAESYYDEYRNKYNSQLVLGGQSA